MTQPCTHIARRLWPMLGALALSWAACDLSHAAADDDDDTATPASKSAAAGPGRWRWGADPLLLEAAALRNGAPADTAAALRTQLYASGQSSAWEWRAGWRLFGDRQPGVPSDQVGLKSDWGDTYLRWRLGETRLTAGMQTVVWGRVDAVSVIDRVSRADYTRLALDDLKDRRLPQPMLRWEQSIGDDKLDAVWLWQFLPARLAGIDSVWTTVHRDTAQVIGVEPAPTAVAPLFKVARLTSERPAGAGGAALRYTHTGESIDLGVSAGRVRQPLPYFTLDPAQLRIVSSQPFTRYLAIDAERSSGSVIWRSEVAYTLDSPMTDRATGLMRRARALEAALGVEFFPGGRDTRVNLQLIGRSMHVGVPTLELQHYSAISGEIETSFGEGRWKAGLRFSHGLDIAERYLSPRLTYTGWEPHELYVTTHRFGGAPQSFGGFLRRNDAVAVGLKTRF